MRNTAPPRSAQRRAGPRPNDCTFPAAASKSSARCTVRGLVPSAIASAELDQGYVTGCRARKKAEAHRRMLLFDRRRQRDEIVSCVARRQRKAALPVGAVAEHSQIGAKPSDFDAQPGAVEIIGLLRPEGACEERAPRHFGQASASARASTRTIPGVSPARPPRVRHARRGGVFPPPDAPDCKSASTSSSTRGRSFPRVIRRPAVMSIAASCAFDLRRQRGDVGLARGVLGPRERRRVPSSAGAGSRFPPRRVRARPATRAAKVRGRVRRACVQPLRCGRSAAGAGLRDCAHGWH